MKRIFLLLATNLAMMVVISLVVSAAGVNHWMSTKGLSPLTLLAYCSIFGFSGAVISLLISRPMAKWSTGAKVIDGSEGETERWLFNVVAELSQKAGIAMPQVAIYASNEPNAFATGATRNRSLVAVSTGLLSALEGREVVAVLGHEIAHVANGDMTLMSLLQGTVNTFTMFFARVVGFVVDRVLLKNENANGPAYGITVFVCDILFGLLGTLVVAAFSRSREFRADSGSSQLLDNPVPMIAALAKLESFSAGSLPQGVQALGISGRPKSWGSLFATHPPIAKRIEALRHLS